MSKKPNIRYLNNYQGEQELVFLLPEPFALTYKTLLKKLHLSEKEFVPTITRIAKYLEEHLRDSDAFRVEPLGSTGKADEGSTVLIDLLFRPVPEPGHLNYLIEIRIKPQLLNEWGKIAEYHQCSIPHALIRNLSATLQLYQCFNSGYEIIFPTGGDDRILRGLDRFLP